MHHAQIDTLPAIVHPAFPGYVSFASWLAQQPAERPYNWNLSASCLAALYLREACGIAEPAKAYPDGYEELLGPDYFRIAERAPWTCGAALARMRAAR